MSTNLRQQSDQAALRARTAIVYLLAALLGVALGCVLGMAWLSVVEAM